MLGSRFHPLLTSSLAAAEFGDRPALQQVVRSNGGLMPILTAALASGTKRLLPTRSNIAIAMVIILLTAWALPTAVRGQSAALKQDKTATAEIPFDFYTLDTKCPAGSYSVTAIGPTFFFIRNEKTHVAAQIFTIADPEFPVDGKKPKLVFVNRDGRNYLVGLVGSHGFERVSGLFGITGKDGDVRKEVLLNANERPNDTADQAQPNTSKEQL
jgi:hypothetical protein